MIYTVCQTFLVRRFSRKYADFFALTALSLALFFVNRQHSSILNFATTVITALCLALLLFTGFIKEKIYCCSLACLVLFATEYVGFHILANGLEAYSITAVILSTLVIKLTAFIILQWVCRNAKTKEFHFTGSRAITGCVFFYPVSCLVVLVGLRYSNIQIMSYSAGQILLAVGLLLLLFSNMLLFFLYDYIVGVTDRMREYEAQLTREYLMQQHFTSLQEVNHRYASLLHDVNNYIRTIQTLQMEEQSSRIHHITESLMEEISNVNGTTYCASPIINAVLHEKEQEAAKLHIDFQIFVEPFFPNPTIADNDLISLLCNLIDNAIESAAQCADPYVKTTIFVNCAHQVIKIRNSSPGRRIKKQSRFSTTKSDTQNHGFGVRRVEDITEKYGGILSCDTKDSEFTAIVVLPLKNFSV